MPINVPGLPTSTKTPGFFTAVVIGGSGTAGGVGRPRLLLFGNMVASNLTGSAPSFTVTAGTRQTGGTVDETPIQVNDSDEAATYFGRGSCLHRQAKAAFRAFQGVNLYCCPVAEGGGATKASATLTFVGDATSSGTIRIVIADETFDIGITSGDAIATMAENVAKEITLKHPNLPVTAQFALGVTTVTAKQGGVWGNDIPFRAYFVDGTNVIQIGSSTSKFGTAATITGSGKLASGATADSVATALTNTAAERYHRQALHDTDTTNINRVRDAIQTKSVATQMLWEQLVTCSISTPSTAQTNAAAVNHERVQIVHAENNDMLPGEIAAQVAAFRLFGDSSAVSNPLDGEEQDPAANLNGLETWIPVPAAKGDYPTATEVENMLNNGVSPLRPSSAHPGYMTLVASYTTKHKDSSGNFNYAAAETKVVSVADHCAEVIRNDFSSTYKGFKLRADYEDGRPMDLPKVLTPTIAHDRVAKNLKDLEQAAIITNADAMIANLKVEIDANNKSRLNIDTPVAPIPNASIVGNIIRQVSA